MCAKLGLTQPHTSRRIGEMQPHSSFSSGKNGSTKRVSFRLSGRVLGRIDGLVEKGKFTSRSEVIREAITELLVMYDTERASEEA